MAHKRSGRPPHKVGDVGCKRDVIGKRSVRISAAGISMIICHEAGKTVAYTMAPKATPIVVEEVVIPFAIFPENGMPRN